MIIAYLFGYFIPATTVIIFIVFGISDRPWWQKLLMSLGWGLVVSLIIFWEVVR